MQDPVRECDWCYINLLYKGANKPGLGPASQKPRKERTVMRI